MVTTVSDRPRSILAVIGLPALADGDGDVDLSCRPAAVPLHLAALSMVAIAATAIRRNDPRAVRHVCRRMGQDRCRGGGRP